MGKHLKVLGRGASTLLADHLAVSSFLVSLVRDLEFVEPQLHLSVLPLGETDDIDDEGALTGFAVFPAAHIMIHTWPIKHYFMLDVFSGREFEPTAVADNLRRCFGAFKTMTTDFSHALDYFDRID